MLENAMYIFKEILKTETYYEIVKYGFAEAPLTLLGYFLRIVGNILLRHIYAMKNFKIF